MDSQQIKSKKEYPLPAQFLVEMKMHIQFWSSDLVENVFQAGRIVRLGSLEVWIKGFLY